MLNRRMLSSLILTAVLGIGWLNPAGARAASHKDVLDLIPDDAWGFVLASSLDGIDAKANLIKSTLGFPIPDEVTGLALASFNIADVIDRASPICAVMMNAQKFASPDKAAVLIVPAKDPKVMLERFEAEAPVEGVSKCIVMGEPAYAAVRNKMIILGPDLDCVTRVSKTKKTLGDSISKTRLAVLEKCDFFLSISLAAVVNTYKDQYLPLFQMMMAPTDPEGKNVKRMIKALTEVGSLDLAVSMNDAGFALRILVDAVGDSDLQKLFSDEKPSADALIAGLPRENFLFTMGSSTTYSEFAASFTSQSPLSDMIQLTGMEGIDTKALEVLDKEIIKLKKSIKRYAVSISAMPEGSDGMFGLAFVAETEDADAFMTGIRKAYETAWKVSEDEEVAAMKEAIVHKADAETIDGKKVDTLTFDLKKLSELDEDESDAELKHVQTLLGKDFVLRFGAADDRKVVITFGGGKSRYETTCKALKSSGELLSTDKGIKEMAGQLPTPRVTEIFVSVDTILQTVKRALAAIGDGSDEFPIEVPTLNSPIGCSTTIQEKVMRIDCLVPMKLLKAGKEAYDKYSASSADEDFDELDDEQADDTSGDTDMGDEDE